jgi:anti-sigma factor RsiW
LNCQELESQLHAYVDGELTPAQRADVDKHLEGCPDCRAHLKDWQVLHLAFQTPELRHIASDTLRQRLGNALQKETGHVARPQWHRWAAAAAVGVVAVALGWQFIPHGDEDDAMVDAAVAQQQQAVSSKHISDFNSNNPSVIEAWLSHQLPFVPPVQDLSKQGYALMGVRVDQVKGQPAAALIYRHGESYVTVFVCQATKPGDKDLDTDTNDDYHVVYWTHGNYSFWTVSQMDADELKRFGTLLRAAT